MRFSYLIPITMSLLGLAACSPGHSAIGSGPQGVSSTAPSASSQAPQPVNSLPDNTSVNAPLTTGTGRIGTSRTGTSRTGM